MQLQPPHLNTSHRHIVTPILPQKKGIFKRKRPFSGKLFAPIHLFRPDRFYATWVANLSSLNETYIGVYQRKVVTSTDGMQPARLGIFFAQYKALRSGSLGTQGEWRL